MRVPELSTTPSRVAAAAVTVVLCGGLAYGTLELFSPSVPAPVVTSRPDHVTGEPTATIEFTGAQRGLPFQCSHNGSAFATCESPVVYANLEPGRQVFAVRSIAPGGSASPARTITWRIRR
ncbi:MAG: cytochrome c [Cryptosporangiaceae bacterium]|jgi:hypothetical protein|nr:cytochrome c [Cryptosporangiaceae bacterium]MDQ1659698.1 cytochrome c [Cryptosporangiaceae bacterium]